jgi:hypothetical protein
MKQAIFATALTFVGSSAAFAVDTPLLNGSFETQNPQGFSQTITNWSVSFTDSGGNAISPPAAFAGPPAQYSGLFTSFGTRFVQSVVPNGTAFAMLSNLGAGVVTLQSDAATASLPLEHNFAVLNRNLAFRYAYLTNDPLGNAHDAFTVRVDFFATATSTTSIGSITQLVADSATLNNTGAGFSPFGGVNNPTNGTFNNALGTGANTFNLFNVDISAYFGSFARVSFIVDNNGAGAGTNGNGLGVSGIVLDDILLNPEPSTMALFGLGVLGLGGVAWRRRAAKKPAA